MFSLILCWVLINVAKLPIDLESLSSDTWGIVLMLATIGDLNFLSNLFGKD